MARDGDPADGTTRDPEETDPGAGPHPDTPAGTGRDDDGPAPDDAAGPGGDIPGPPPVQVRRSVLDEDEDDEEPEQVTEAGTRKLSAGASTALALVGAGLLAAFIYPPWPAPATEPNQPASAPVTPSRTAATGARPVPPCDRTLDKLGDVFVRAKTNPTAAPVADGAPFADCTMRGTLAIAGNPSGTLRVTYGRSSGIAGLTAEQRARDAVDAQAISSCVEEAAPVQGFPYAVRCGDDAPRVHELVLVADGDVYLSVEVTVRSVVADKAGVRKNLAAAAGAAAAKVHAQVR
ncbi:hypothetical protein AB0M43_12455 [Longispora sp. NPDC051575]|uniref:hypothetical protein n=1 Tax=Longispora sp. NPDC051575 TaxID=3154943 RepID=UPI00341C0BFC